MATRVTLFTSAIIALPLLLFISGCGGGGGNPFGVKSELVTKADHAATMAFAPDGRLFYGEQLTGNIRVVTADGELLDEPVVMFTDICQDDRVARQRHVQLVDHTFGSDRCRIADAGTLEEARPLFLESGEARQPRGVSTLGGAGAVTDEVQELADDQIDIADDPDFHRIVAPKLLHLEIDVDELRRRYRIRHAGDP